MDFFFCSPPDDFFPCFLEAAAFFLGAGVEGVVVVGATAGAGAGEGGGVLSLGSGAVAGRGVEDSSFGVFSRLREIRPLASRVSPAMEKEQVTMVRRAMLGINFMTEALSLSE